MFAVEDASGFTGQVDEILSPRTSEEVAALLTRANRERQPVTISGAGTGVTGGRVPSGGILLSLDRFKRLDIKIGRALAGAGISLNDLQTACLPTRQFYAPDPTEWTASVGGSIATNASGSRSFRYGSTRKHVLSLTVALMDGSLHTFRRGEAVDFEVPALPIPNTTKCTAGYPLCPGMDWLDLFIGSEGTLGVVLEAELVLLPAPEDLLSGVVFFDTDAAALDAVDQWRSIPTLRMLEYFDQSSGERYVPHVIEPAAGADRATLAFLVDAYDEELVEREGTGEGEMRTVLRLHPRLAPVKAAVLPLVNKDGLPDLAGEVRDALRGRVQSEYDDGGAIGRRYRRQDEIGTPFCLTIDHQSLDDRTVTLRDRDSLTQERLPVEGIGEEIERRVNAPWRTPKLG